MNTQDQGSNEAPKSEVKPGDFPYPLPDKGRGESEYLTWLRNHSNYMASRGFLDYMRAVGVLVRGIMINFLAILPGLLILSVVVAWFYEPYFDGKNPIKYLDGDQLVYSDAGPNVLDQKNKAIIESWNHKSWFTKDQGAGFSFLTVESEYGAVQHALQQDPAEDGYICLEDKKFVILKDEEIDKRNPADIGGFIGNGTGELMIEFPKNAVAEAITDLVQNITFKKDSAKADWWDIEGKVAAPNVTFTFKTNNKAHFSAKVEVLDAEPEEEVQNSSNKTEGDNKTIFGWVKKHFGKDPFKLTNMVLVIFCGLVLFFPIASRLLKIVGYRRIKETNRGSSVKQRDIVERLFGGSLVALLIGVMIGALPHLVDWLYRTPLNKETSIMLAGGIMVVLLSANKLLSKLSGAKKVFMMFLVAIAGLLVPLLVIINTAQFLAYVKTIELWHWLLLLIIPVVFVVTIWITMLVGAMKRSISLSGFFIKLPLIWLGIVVASLLVPLLGIFVFTFSEARDVAEKVSKLTKAQTSALLESDGKPVKTMEEVHPDVLTPMEVQALKNFDAAVSSVKNWREAAQKNIHFVFVLALAFQIWMFCYLALDVNSTSIHGLYRDRLASAYLVGKDTDKKEVDIEEDINLFEICRYEMGSTAPYHLVNVALNLQGSKDPDIRDRQSDFFFFSKKYIGGNRTGYCDTLTMDEVHPAMSLATAMAISAAAASPNMGQGTNPAMVAFLTLLNVRLGYWLPNPGVVQQMEGPGKNDPKTWRRIKKERKKGKGKYVPGFDFAHVLTDELKDIQSRRCNCLSARETVVPTIGAADQVVLNAAWRSELVGLGFSGGGIRSATINLGIVQVLHHKGIFDQVDYMSTVSGGGYLGSSISTLMRQKENSLTGKSGTSQSKPPEAGHTKPVTKKKHTYWKMFKWRIRPASFVNELRSKLDETTKWVNLSDGGHIENLAGIELLRRRCKFIILGDGEADPSLSFNGLATLIRYARIDLNITIDIDVNPITLDMSEQTLDEGRGAHSHKHFAVGTITYPEPDEAGILRKGYLLYLKSSYTGDEDIVIREYRTNNPLFPHESTADQSFDEGQFEAYHALGKHIAESAFKEISKSKGIQDKFTLKQLAEWKEAMDNPGGQTVPQPRQNVPAVSSEALSIPTPVRPKPNGDQT